MPRTRPLVPPDTSTFLLALPLSEPGLRRAGSARSARVHAGTSEGVADETRSQNAMHRMRGEDGGVSSSAEARLMWAGFRRGRVIPAALEDHPNPVAHERMEDDRAISPLARPYVTPLLPRPQAYLLSSDSTRNTPPADASHPRALRRECLTLVRGYEQPSSPPRAIRPRCGNYHSDVPFAIPCA
jgi:hypothetical protein